MARKKSNQDIRYKDSRRIGGYLFLVVAFLMLFSETSRALAVAFFAIGIALLVIKYDDTSEKKK